VFQLMIQNSQSERVRASRLVSPKFGVISEDWTIPDTAATGTYRIWLESEEEGYCEGSHAVRVSRYELPEFKVTATPDRTVYLPSETPLITVAGQYLFGKPVTEGRVRILRLPGWSGEENEGETIAEGNTDLEGTFTASLDLSKDYEDLEENSRYRRFEDLRFAAYFTDRTSGGAGYDQDPLQSRFSG
jgi:CD109 antigen